MGYTRYFKNTGKKFTLEFLEDVCRIVNQCRELGIDLRDGEGTAETVITFDAIIINGRAEEFACEPLVMYSGDNGWDFCKTRRLPYDLAVMNILKVAEKHGIVKDVGSDGGNGYIGEEEK